MTTTEIIGPDLKTVLRRLKLGRMLDTLPERVLLARQQKLPHQEFLLLVLSDEATRRDSLAVTLRVQRARLDAAMHLDAWDPTPKVTFDRALLNELTTVRFLEAHAHVAIIGPVGCPSGGAHDHWSEPSLSFRASTRAPFATNTTPLATVACPRKPPGIA